MRSIFFEIDKNSGGAITFRFKAGRALELNTTKLEKVTENIKANAH
ncbi:MAG: hypothetical protein ABIO05_03075 [Ferruginibacter sp.]